MVYVTVFFLTGVWGGGIWITGESCDGVCGLGYGREDKRLAIYRK